MPALSYLAVLEFAGADAQSFLHNQLSADISNLEEGAATYACLCHPKGRVIALLLVQKTEHGAMAVCSSALASRVSQRLGMYVLRDDVRIRERPDLHVHGVVEDGVNAALHPLPGLAYRLGVDGPKDGQEAWKERELAHGVAWLDSASSEQFLPQMLGFEEIGALSFRKGCFPGQEIIARTHYLGKLKRHPLLVITSTPFEPDAMEAVTVSGSGQQAPAVVVDHAPQGSSGTRLFLVVRTAEPFPASDLEWRGQTLSIANT